MTQTYDLAIIGGGPAGLTAALYTARDSLKTLLVEGNPRGGQLTMTSHVENFPGFPMKILGAELIDKMRDQALSFGATSKEENVVKISGDFPKFKVETDAGNEYIARTVLIATGSYAKLLDLESAKRLRGMGVSACAVCDGYFFRGKTIAVVGGGDSAMEESTYLTKFATKVYVLVRGPKEKLRASSFMKDRAFNNEKIIFMFNTEVREVFGNGKVEGLKIVDNATGKESIMSDVQGLFIAVGHKPNTDFLKGFIDLDELGYVKVTDKTMTSKAGVYVGGDAADQRYRQAVTAAGMGCMAALDIEKFLAQNGQTK